MNSTEYIQVLRVVCDVIGVTDPDATVLLASPFFAEALEAANGRGMWLLEVLEEVKVNPKLNKCIRAVGLHSFGRARHPYYLMSGIAAQSQFPNIPIWMTETGVMHAGSPFCSEQPCASELETADYVMQVYAWTRQALAQKGLDGKLFHYRLMDGSFASGHNGPWGLLASPDTPYPAYYAAQLIVEKLNGATWYADESQEGVFHRIVFQGKNDEYINVVWAVEDIVSNNANVLLAHEGMSTAIIYEITGTFESVPWTLAAVSGSTGNYYLSSIRTLRTEKAL